MRYFIILILLCFSVSTNLYAMGSKQEKFINFMKPKIAAVNQKVGMQRQRLLELYTMYQAGRDLSKDQKFWVLSLAKDYDVHDFELPVTEDWLELMKRVDEIPTALVLAQSINESAWGTSRFARQGKNYFGEWCYTKGCGLVPKRRAKGGTYEVEKFNTPTDSIISYFHLVNTLGVYRQLRELRWKMRLQEKPLSAITLSTGLTQYSTRREAYVRSLQGIMKKYLKGELYH